MSAPWMPLYIADYLADTGHLSAAESGAYLHLIMNYWRHGKLPQDDVSLARIARMSAREWSKCKATIQAFFQDGWRHKRIDFELEKSARKSEARAEFGARGGRAKALKDKDATVAKATNLPEQNAKQKDDFAVASSSQPQSQLEANASNKRASARSPRSDGAELLIEFEGEFWPAYPHKVGKPDAIKAFVRARKSHELPAIMVGLDFYKRTKPADRSWLNPSTFLNQERFNDQPAGVQARAGPSTGSVMARAAMGDFGDGGDGFGSSTAQANGIGAGGGFDGLPRHAAALSQPDRMASLGPLLDLRAEPADGH